MAYEVSQRTLIPQTANARAPRQGLVFFGNSGADIAYTEAFGIGDFTFSAIVSSYSITSSTYTWIFGGYTNSLAIAIKTTAIRLTKVDSQEIDLISYSFLPNKPYLITVTRKSGIRYTYVNGSLVQQASDTNSYTGSTRYLNGYNSSTSLSTGCLIEFPLIYNRGLSESEVISIYETGSAAPGDYNSATNTIISSTTFAIDLSGAGSLSGISSAQFTLTYTSGNIPYVYNNGILPVGIGKKVRLRFSLNRASGGAVLIAIGEAGTGANLDVQLGPLTPAYGTATYYDVELTQNYSYTNPRIYIYPQAGAAATFTVTSYMVNRLGLLVAVDSSQFGGGGTWYDVSGNNQYISFNLTNGVSWSIPFGGYITSNQTDLYLKSDSSSTNGIFLKPGSSSFVNIYQPTLSSTSETRGLSIRNVISSRLLGLGVGNTYNWIQSFDDVPLVINELGGNVLIGLTTNSGYKLDVGGTARFSGKITTSTSSITYASINIPHGSTPLAPNNGDMWTTTTGLYIQINGVTVGPLGTGGGGGAVSSVSGTTNQVTVSPTTGAVVVSLPTSIINVNSLTAQSATDFTINAGSSGATIVAGQGTNGSVVLTAKGTGGVGIGTSTPASMLDISNLNYLTFDGPTFRMGNIHGADALVIDAYPNNRPGNYDGVGIGGSVRILAKPVGGYYSLIGTDSNSNLGFVSNSLIRMRILSGGNVLIGGSVDGGQKLQVSGNSVIYSTGLKSIAETPLVIGTATGGANDFQLVFYRTNAGSAGSFYSIESVEQGISYRNLVLQPNGGNVGIGVTPSEKFHVNGGNAYISYATDTATYSPTVFNSSPRLALLSKSATGAYNLIRYTAGGSHEWAVGTVHQSSGTADYVFQSYNGSAYGERVRINSSGNVGIGTNSPITKLDVNGSVRIVNTLQIDGFDSVNSQRAIGFGGNTLGTNPVIYSNGNYIAISAATNQPVYINSDTNGSVLMSGSGSVGIGTTSPSQKLEVRGNIKLGADNSGNYIYYVTDSESTIIRTTRSDVTQEGLLKSDAWGNFLFNKSIGVGYSIGAGPLTGNIYAAGSIGIGTTSPAFKLDNYNSTFRSLSVAAEKLVSVTFANGVANQKVDIIFDITPGGTVFWGNLEVEITSGYDNQNSVGKLIKVFSVGLNPAGGSGPYNSAIYDNTSYYSAAYGVVADNWAIDGIFFNATTGKYYFTVIHRVSTGNSIQIKVKGFSQGVSHSTSISTLTAGSVYTTNTTVYYKPVIESVAQRIGYNGNINQTADLIVQGIVGLGTSSPAAPLHVRGQNGGGDITLKLQEYNGGTWTFHSGGRFAIDKNDGTSMLSIEDTTAPNGYLNIFSGGNVGIRSTVDSGYALFVNSANDYQMMINDSSGTGSTALFLGASGAEKAAIRHTSSTNIFKIGTFTSGGTTILCSNSFETALTLDSNKNANFAKAIGFGGASANTYYYINGSPSLSGNSNQAVFLTSSTFGSDCTGQGNVIWITPKTTAASYTMAALAGLKIESPIIGAGSVVTTAYGVRIASITGGQTNYAILTNSGLVSIGDTTASTSTTTGALIVSGGVGVAGNGYFGGNGIFGGGNAAGASTLTVNYTSVSKEPLGFANTASGGKTWYIGDGTGTSAGIFGFRNATDSVTALTINGSGDGTFAGSVTVNGILTANTSIESLRANRSISGGGIITVDASYNVIWSTRFIVISNGRGSNFSTNGYFDITCPTSGTITGVGGASSVTATSNGIPLNAWTALYYILPIGSANSSLAANFRVVSYTSDINIPAEWVLICIRNGDSDYTYFANGIVLSANQSSVGGLQTNANTANSVVKRDGSGNFSANAATFASTVTATQFIATAGSSTAGSVWAATTAGLIIQAKTGSIQDFVITNPGATANIIEVATGTINAKLAGITSITNTTASSSTTTGALIVSGGVGIAGATFIGGNLTVSGALTVQDGTESTGVFGLKSFTKSLQIGTTWLDTGISGTDLTTGSYLVQVFVNNYTVSGGQYDEYYTGTMSWFSTTTNSTDYDEIVLHKAGHAPNGNWINLRTVRQAPNLTLKLQIIASGNTTGAVNYVFKFRRLV